MSSRGRINRRPTGGRAKAAIFLFVSLGAAVAATLVIFNLVRGLNTELAKAKEKEKTITVVIAKKDLYPGDTITPEDVELWEISPDFVPETVFHDPKDVRDRVPLDRILKSEFVRAERLAESGSGVGLNALIPRGMRAVSIDVTDASSVAGFINPGNYVDVLVTIKSMKKTTETVTLLQAVKVLAVNNRLGGDVTVDTSGQKVKPSVTIAVTPVEVEKLALAQAEGDMTLTLRNDVDVNPADTKGATANKIIGREGFKQQVTKESLKARAGGGGKRPGPKGGSSSGGKTAGPEGETLQVIHGDKVQYQSVDDAGNTSSGKSSGGKKR